MKSSQIFLLLINCIIVFAKHDLNPVILVPGLGGTQIEARLNKKTSPHFYCAKSSDWYTLWLSIEQIEVESCMIENLRLSYNASTGKTYNQEGVETRQSGFGHTETIEWLDPFHRFWTESYFVYFYTIVEHLVHQYGYERGVTVRGTPFDFRKAPNENEQLFAEMTKLVQDTYELNGNKKVVLIGHSMGNNYILYWMNSMSKQWKDTYIATYISLAAPWAGSHKTLKLLTSGDSLGVNAHIINALEARPAQRSMPSTAWLMPYDTYWKADEVLVMSPTRNYTVNDYDQLLKDIDFVDGIGLRKQTEHLIKDLKDPEIEVHCVYSLFGPQSTSEILDFRSFKGNWYDNEPTLISGQGDGTVNIRSLEACQKWSNVKLYKIEKADHLTILHDDRTLDYISHVLNSIKEKNVHKPDDNLRWKPFN